jgi:hypothetical protein
MAIIEKLQRIEIERDVAHSPVEATYSIVEDAEGRRCLQIDTYGSASRKMPGKKSQSLRFTPGALVQLVAILKDDLGMR